MHQVTRATSREVEQVGIARDDDIGSWVAAGSGPAFEDITEVCNTGRREDCNGWSGNDVKCLALAVCPRERLSNAPSSIDHTDRVRRFSGCVTDKA
jgi:hypothetical protein